MRTKKYSVKQLNDKINAYFKSISYTKNAQILVPTKRVNKNGMPVMEYKDLYNDDGIPIKVTEYAVAPTISGLCTYLDVTRQCLYKYKQDRKYGEKYADIIDMARTRIESYLNNQLDTKEKGQAGIQFDLQCNHNWKVTEKEEETNTGISIHIEAESQDEANDFSG